MHLGWYIYQRPNYGAVLRTAICWNGMSSVWASEKYGIYSYLAIKPLLFIIVITSLSVWFWLRLKIVGSHCFHSLGVICRVAEFMLDCSRDRHCTKLRISTLSIDGKVKRQLSDQGKIHQQHWVADLIILGNRLPGSDSRIVDAVDIEKEIFGQSALLQAPRNAIRHFRVDDWRHLKCFPQILSPSSVTEFCRQDLFARICSQGCVRRDVSPEVVTGWASVSRPYWSVVIGCVTGNDHNLTVRPILGRYQE